MRRILRNSIICPDGKELVSRHRYDFVVYYDKKKRCFGVDGGENYLKRTGIGYTENSVIDDGKFETQRNVCEWGKNYDKSGKKLKQTEWVKVKYLETEHIYNILRDVPIDEFYTKLLTEEIIYREELILKSYGN